LERSRPYAKTCLKKEQNMPDKLDTFEARVRELAFKLWHESGCPENRADEFWQQARDIEMREFDLSEADLKKVAKEQSSENDAADFA
jgi:hypothetical protein